MEPLIARKTWRTLEPLHGMIYFVPEADEAYQRLGLKAPASYFASRSAPMGQVGAQVVIATFYNFCPSLVDAAIPAAWDVASPAAILEARFEAASAALVRGLGDDVIASPELAEAASLARRAAEAASGFGAGRPLFAGHAGLPWPEEQHLVLWHAQTLLREFRGDGHIAALVLAGLDPVEALVSHVASGEVDVRFLRSSRAWGDDDWEAAVDRLRSRGLVEAGDPLTFTDKGRQLRQEIEDRTDALAVPAYEVLGEDGCERLRELGRPLSKAIVGAGLLALPGTGQ